MSAALQVGRALTALAADAGRAGWVQLMPAAGEVAARDGRRWVLSDAQAVVKASLAHAGKTPIAIDYEHQAERAETNGQPAPAAGWINSLEARKDGIWGQVEWTARAAEFIANREYRFLSPTFTYLKDSGQVTRIHGAALTNRPALEMTALAKDQSMDAATQALAQLRALFGLADDAAPDAVVEAARTAVAGATASVDPAMFVPMAVFEKAVGELNRASRGVSAEAAAIVVDREVAAGRLMPSMKDWGISLCTENKPAFEAFLERTSGGLQQLFDPHPLRGAFTPGPDPLDEEIARNLGLKA